MHLIIRILTGEQLILIAIQISNKLLSSKDSNDRMHVLYQTNNFFLKIIEIIPLAAKKVS